MSADTNTLATACAEQLEQLTSSPHFDATNLSEQRIRVLALNCAQQLLEMLRSPNFNMNNTEHLRRADTLWIGALVARRDVQS